MDGRNLKGIKSYSLRNCSQRVVGSPMQVQLSFEQRRHTERVGSLSLRLRVEIKVAHP